MKLALALAALLCSSLPAFAQSELDKMREEIAKLKAESAAKTAMIAELQSRLTAGGKAAERAQQDEAARALLTELQQAQKPLVKSVPAPTPPAPAPAPPPQPYWVTPGRVYKVTPPAPLLPMQIEGKVTAVANEIGLVVISVGTESGVRDGDEFTIYRGGDFVAKMVIDRSDRRWSAGKVVLKKADPRVADDVSNHIFVSAPRTGATVPEPVPAPVPSKSSAEELRSLRKELDEVRNQVRQLSDRLVPSWQDAGVSVDEVPEELRAHLGILRGLLVRRVREGSPAEKAGLKANDVIPDLLEPQVLEAIQTGLPIQIVRQGQRTKLPGAKGK